jgi:hypothetical protein
LSGRVLKLTLTQTLRQDVELPDSWRPLTFANFKGDPVVWYEGESIREDRQPHEGPRPAVKVRLIWLLFTGDVVPDKARYIGSDIFGATRSLVVHCYVE